MSDERYERLREAGWRHPLAKTGQAELRAWLSAHPEAQADWEAEAALTAGLRQLPDVPLPSNFTARVLQEVERERLVSGRKEGWGGRDLDWRRWVPRLAVVTLAAGALLISVKFYEAANRAKLGASVAVLAEVTPAPSPDCLADFDSIRKLTASPGADTELLALLQ
jgi:anti-sigma factor RsiW